MLVKASRTFKFSNGQIITVGFENNSSFVNVNGRSFPLRNINLDVRHNVINIIRNNFKIDKKIKIDYEDYYCFVVAPNEKVSFEIKATPSSKGTNIMIVCDNKPIFKGNIQVVFDNIKGIQDFARSKVFEYLTRLKSNNPNTIHDNMMYKLQSSLNSKER